MEQRAVEMHRVLKDTGSLYLHCDPTASHYLKVMLDGVFGIKQFRNEIVWYYKKPPSQGKKFERHHNTILGYSKTDNWIWNQQYQPKSETTIKRNGLRTRQIIGRKPSGKRIDKSVGKIAPEVPCGDVWYFHRVNRIQKQRVGYPTQKPIALYERIIKASSNQHDIVLDPFAGSGTTLDAAQTLGRHWIGIDSGKQAIETIIGRMRDNHGLEYDRDYEIHT